MLRLRKTKKSKPAPRLRVMKAKVSHTTDNNAGSGCIKFQLRNNGIKVYGLPSHELLNLRVHTLGFIL
jgi:hypothetical protein